MALTYILKGEEIVCHKNLPYHLAPTWYKEKWRLEVDQDYRYEAIGMASRRHRGGNNQTIAPMVDDEKLFRNFYRYAKDTLQLSDLYLV